MHKIKSLSVKRFRLLNVEFDNGRKGIFHIKDKFTGVAAPLKDPEVFATAKSINNGSAVGFTGCEYDICGQNIYQSFKPSRAVRGRTQSAHLSH